jgi:butyrate response factor 1
MYNNHSQHVSDALLSYKRFLSDSPGAATAAPATLAQIPEPGHPPAQPAHTTPASPALPSASSPVLTVPLFENFKTEMCTLYRDTGACPFAAGCHYAHGVEEIRPRNFGPRYKTELCQNYHLARMCRFGTRCRFIHDEIRAKKSDTEYWLLCPSENLAKLELVESAVRQHFCS